MEAYILKEYLKRIINDESLGVYMPEIISSFTMLQLKKNDFFEKKVPCVGISVL